MEELIAKCWEEERITRAGDRTALAPLGERLYSCPSGIQHRQKHTYLNTQTLCYIQGQSLGRQGTWSGLTAKTAEG